MSTKINVLVVEDEKNIGNFISTTLKNNHYKVIECQTGSEALSITSSHCPDVILLDLGLPDLDGLTVLKSIRNWSSVPIIIISARTQEHEKVEALDLGADDYITKPFNVKILKKKIVAILKRYRKIQDNIYEIKYLKVDMSKREVYKRGNLISLTPTEYRILELFVQEKNKVITKDNFIEVLYKQNGDYIDEHALSVYISRLRCKIEETDNPIIKTIYGMGYMWIEE